MRLDKLTEKSREALLEAQHLAEQYTHPAVEPEHLLAALLAQENGVVPSVIRKLGSRSCSSIRMLGVRVSIITPM